MRCNSLKMKNIRTLFRNWASLACLLAAFTGASLAQASYAAYRTGSSTSIAASPEGGVCLMGGASEQDEAMKWFLRRSGGGDILVLRASGSDGYNAYLYSELGVAVNSVETIVCHSRAAAFDPYVLQRVQEAEAVWLAGGDQWNYVSRWRGTPLDSLLRSAVSGRGLAVGGTSAGMAVLGGLYFTAEQGTVSSAQALGDPFASRVALDSAPFLGAPFLDQVLTDTHYDNPDRRGRHLAFLARMRSDWGILPYGIACDEYTAICIDSAGLARVYGNHPSYDDNAYFLQLNCEVADNRPELCAPGQPLTWNQGQAALRVYAVKGTASGSRSFDLRDWRSGNGGNWEYWYAEAGSLMTRPAPAPACALLGAEALAPLLFSLHPNPAAGQVWLRAGDQPVQGAELLDLLGRRLASFVPGPGGWQLSAEPLPPGLYLVRAWGGGREGLLRFQRF
jgi:cyanophycinase-like exopeptidase